MKHIIYWLPLFILSCSDQRTKSNSEDPIKIDSTWQKKTINKVLTISLPDSSLFEHSGYVKANYGQGKSGYYCVDHYDTVLAYVNSQTDFKQALKEFLGIQFGHAQLIPCDLIVIDTTIGNSAGYFITGYSTDSLASCKYPFCYLTLANNHFYWFYACQSSSNITHETRQFFQSIQFIRENFKEADYKLPHQRIRKIAGLGSTQK
jgi:hypothetical protein